MSDGDQHVGSASQQAISTSTSSQPDSGPRHEATGSPQRPSYSPVTPTLSHASLASQDGAGADLPPPQWLDEVPEPLPISLDENPDAIALRATLSILQLQRQQALKDMRDLDKMKKAALDAPEQFVQDLQASRLTRPARAGVEVDDVESSDGEGEAEPEGAGGSASRFGQFPVAQNVVRSPPIEWSKYHIVGEPLDRIHRIQQQYPGATEQILEGRGRGPPHTTAAPYRPFVDKLDDTKSSSNTRNPGS
jgi:hypothetical protein